MNASNSTSEVLLAGMFPAVLSLTSVESWIVILSGISVIVFNGVKTYFLIKNKGK